MAVFRVEIIDKGIKKRLDKLGEGLKDYTKPLKDSADFSAKVFQDNFDIIGAEFVKWAPLSPKTIEMKAKFGFPLTPLIATGKMMRSFATFKLERFAVTIGNRLENKYFPYHQLGTKRIPQRKMIEINQRMKDEIMKIFTEYLKKLLNT